MQCFKTRYCRFFSQGRCTRGSNCSFAHDESEMRLQPDLTKTKLCTDWRRGRCNNPTCSYAHGDNELKEEEGSFRTSMCVKWREGTCQQANCPYAHSVEELRTLRVAEYQLLTSSAQSHRNKETTLTLPRGAICKQKMGNHSPIGNEGKKPLLNGTERETEDVSRFSVSTIETMYDETPSKECDTCSEFWTSGTEDADPDEMVSYSESQLEISYSLPAPPLMNARYRNASSCCCRTSCNSCSICSQHKSFNCEVGKTNRNKLSKKNHLRKLRPNEPHCLPSGTNLCKHGDVIKEIHSSEAAFDEERASPLKLNMLMIRVASSMERATELTPHIHQSPGFKKTNLLNPKSCCGIGCHCMVNCQEMQNWQHFIPSPQFQPHPVMEPHLVVFTPCPTLEREELSPVGSDLSVPYYNENRVGGMSRSWSTGTASPTGSYLLAIQALASTPLNAIHVLKQAEPEIYED